MTIYAPVRQERFWSELGFTCSTIQVNVEGEMFTVLQVVNPDDCPHCILPVAECECHERGRD